jgi:hypothetical protein
VAQAAAGVALRADVADGSFDVTVQQVRPL